MPQSKISQLTTELRTALKLTPHGKRKPPKVPMSGNGKWEVYMLDSDKHARDWGFRTDDEKRAVSTAKIMAKSGYRVVYILEQPGNNYMGSFV
jgi:hypothetical protein